MSVSGIGSSSAGNPYATLVQQQASTASALFGGTSAGDLSALAPTAAAYSMYENPALLEGLTKWDGSETPGSERTADPTAVAGNTDGIQADYAFNPFDQTSWDAQYPPGSFVDALT